MSTTLQIEKKKTLVPQLRFQEFDGEWTKLKLEAVTDKIQDGTHFSPKVLTEGNYKYITSRNIRNGYMDLTDVLYLDDKEHKNIYKRCNVQLGDILLTKDGSATGTVCINTLDEEFSLLSSVAFIRANNKKVNNAFIYQCIAGPMGQKEIKSSIAGQAITRITLNKLRNFNFSFPTLPEQQKIASFLSVVDEKIQQLSRKKELLEQYKKGVMQQLFSGKLRFKDENGKDYPDWEEKKLGEISTRVTRKNKENNLNVLTISAQLGLVSQLEYFNKSVSAKDVTNYYLLEKNDFAYNKSYSNGYPMGAIKRLKKYEKGVVSTLYICFCFNEIVSLNFMEHYFEFGLHNKEIEKVAQEGARNHGLLNIGVNDFLNIELIIPSKQEQQKIAAFLSSIDTKRESVIQQLAQTQTFKKGLLQQMFI